MSRGGRISSRNILLCNRFWTYVNVMIGGRNHWCLGGGGSRKACTWRGKGESSGGVGQRGGGM